MKKKNSRNTKARIVSAAWQLFYRNGYDDTTIEEIVELVLQKEHLDFKGDHHELVLCAVESGVQMRRDKTLNDYGIVGGAELILV